MRRSDPRAGRSGGGKRKQFGQALVYGIFLLIGGLAALFFLFNTGQLTREKTKLVNTSDAVAYSAGVMHARTLNYDAYANRAMVANTVAIAQLVSLSSWVQYANNLGTWGETSATNPKFALFWPSYYSAASVGPYLQDYLNDSGVLEGLATASDRIVSALSTAQRVASVGLIGVRLQVMNEVAQKNYENDGSVVVDSLALSSTAFTDFVQQYSGSDRTRFAEVAQTAVKRDDFMKKRSWDLPALYSDCAGANLRGAKDWYDRRGGTELIGFEQWQAMDTLSEKDWVPRNKFDVTCGAIAERPVGWGQTQAADNRTIDPDLAHYDYSIPINPTPSAMAMASSSSWGYSGLPAFYELTPGGLAQSDPRLQYAFRLIRSTGETATSEGRSDIKNTARLNQYHAQTAGGGNFVAVSASEAFFQREGNNVYGAGLGKPKELGSLFNPYWQVRLIQAVDQVQTAQLLQGVTVPWPKP